ncbi:uncharacterized protein LOC121853129 [Homarus americanus]|uniref:uncharacterized protein LOC121853129 n=1 Tax=Homarus americanus TaxID=6706 RepID=UPI001C43D177|nr:uncharacterized protein LOC121853129 [Homarus americanus]
MPQNVLKSYLLKMTILTTSEALSPKGVLECSHLCLATPLCISFLLHNDTRSCYLTSLNRCLERNNVLLASPGYFYYERFDNQITTPPTCFSTCLATRDCNACGRKYCSGKDCENCPSTCWDVPSVNGRISLWTRDHSKRFSVTCDQGWFLLWYSGEPVPENTSPTPLKLQVRLLYEGDLAVSSFFKTVKIHKKSLKVGEYLEGKAGNWWGAPFKNRHLTSNSSSNCLPFFNPTTYCKVLGVMNGEEQLSQNDTGIRRSLPWITGINEIDQLKLKVIELWASLYEPDEV